MTIHEPWWKPEAAWPKKPPTGKRLAVLGGRMIDGNGGPVVDKPILLLQGPRITAVGVQGQLKIEPGMETIDLYQVHRFDPNTPIDEMLSGLDLLVRQGKVRMPRRISQQSKGEGTAPPSY